jgi:hypothetical protein
MRIPGDEGVTGSELSTKAESVPLWWIGKYLETELAEVLRGFLGNIIGSALRRYLYMKVKEPGKGDISKEHIHPQVYTNASRPTTYRAWLQI